MELASIYFFIAYKRNEREDDKDVYFTVPEERDLKPECIFKDELNENQQYYYKKIFKVNKLVGKGNTFFLKFEISEEEYSIKFDSKGNTFIYDVKLEYGKRNIPFRNNIPQNKEYYETIEFFIKALERNGEEKMIDSLFKETIELYSKTKGFAFMIELFLKIYQKKDLCPELMKIFKKFNQNPKDNEKNMDRKPFLKDYTSKFKTIISEADTIIENNNYNLIDFYGIVLSYLNYYDKEEFSKIINELYSNSQKNYMIFFLFIKAISNIQLIKTLIFLTNLLVIQLQTKIFQFSK